MILQVTLQLDVEDDREIIDRAKDTLSEVFVAAQQQVEGGTMIGYACEDVTPPEGGPIDIFDGTEFSGISDERLADLARNMYERLRGFDLVPPGSPGMVATPRGPIPDATDDALREARRDHPETCEHAVVLGQDCEGCGGKAVGSAVEQMAQRSEVSVEDGGANGDD